MNFKEIQTNTPILESKKSKSRIQHPEDLIFWDGTVGARTAVDLLSNINNSTITIKWDGCIHRDSKLLTPEGMKSACELYKSIIDGERECVYVFGRKHDGTNVFSKITDVRMIQTPKTWAAIETEYGNRYNITQEHLCFTKHGITAAGDLKHGDTIACLPSDNIAHVTLYDSDDESYDFATDTENFYVFTDVQHCMLVHNSPAVVFGRADNGSFFFTDKSGFMASTYDGKATSPKALYDMIISRGDDPGRRTLAANLAKAFELFKLAVPSNFRGFMSGDMLYFNPPENVNDSMHFKPNTVKYSIAADSDLGRIIDGTQMGIALHYMQHGGRKIATTKNPLISDDIAVIPNTPLNMRVNVPTTQLKEITDILSKYGSYIDALLDSKILRDKQITDFQKIIYRYVNSNVGKHSGDLREGFISWLGSTLSITSRKKTNIIKHIHDNQTGWEQLWEVFNLISISKKYILHQLDLKNNRFTATINGRVGSEGFVVSNKTTQVKLVDRSNFTKANQENHD